MSLYEYALSNPADYTDSLGLCTVGDQRSPTCEIRVEPFGITPTLADAQDELVDLAGDVETLGTIVATAQTLGAGGLAGLPAALEKGAQQVLGSASTATAKTMAQVAKELVKKARGNFSGYQLWTRIAYEECVCKTSSSGFLRLIYRVLGLTAWVGKSDNWEAYTKGGIDGGTPFAEDGATYEDPLDAYGNAKRACDEHLVRWKSAKDNGHNVEE